MAILLGIFSLVLFFIRPWQSARWLFIIPLGFAVGIFISYLHDTADLVSLYHREGAGYTAKAWRNAKILNLVEQLPGKTPIISNESALLLFYTGRPAYDLSELADQTIQTLANRYGDDLADPAQIIFRENGAALVLLNTRYQQFQELYGDKSAIRLKNLTRDLSLYAQTPDGEIYFYSPEQLP
jgi:hypothetical protein